MRIEHRAQKRLPERIRPTINGKLRLTHLRSAPERVRAGSR
jgi:hypothetical protein